MNARVRSTPCPVRSAFFRSCERVAVKARVSINLAETVLGVVQNQLGTGLNLDLVGSAAYRF